MEGDSIAFCPGHISGYFKPEYSHADDAPGSVGGGIVIDRGVTVHASAADAISVTCIYTDTDGVERKRIAGSPVVEHALKSAGISASVITSADLPPESGFGLSGAAIISSLAAGAGATGIDISDTEIFRLAYMTETLFRTGLGDVPAVAGGGYVCRLKPGLGGGIIRRYDMNEPVFILNFGPLSTSGVLGEESIMEKISAAYTSRCPKSPEEFFDIARNFSERSGLITPGVRDALSACDDEGVPACMTMLGNGVFAYGRKAESVLGGLGETEEIRMSKNGFVRGEGSR